MSPAAFALALVTVSAAAASGAAPPKGALDAPPGGPVVATSGPKSLVAVSGDGRSLYAAGGIDARSSIAVFRRDPRTGRLTRPPGRDACVLAWWARSRFRACSAGAALNGPSAVVVAPDGADVLVASWSGAQEFALYRRSRRTGGLRLGACVGGSGGPFRCQPARGVGMTSGAAFSPDGRNVYVASAGIRAVAAFSREPQTGALVQLAGPGACVYRSGVRFPPTPPCATVPSAKFTPVAVVASPDGRNVYVASQTAAEDGAVFVFRRAAASGALTPLPLPDTCVGGAARTVCRKAPQVVLRRGGASSPGGALAISPDGRTVYVAGSSPSGSSEGRNGIVLALRRDPGTGALAPLSGANGCVDGADSPAACAVADALDGVRSLAVSTDGATVYAGTERGAIVVLRRSADGGLAQLPSPHGCLTSDRIPSCGRLPRDALDVEGLAVSRDGRSVYAAAGRLLAFRPR